MLSWPALLLAPLIALGELSIIYAMVSPACASQDRSSLHAVAGVSLLIVVAMTALAWHAWRAHASDVTRADSDAAAARPHFIAQIAVVVGALSTLVCITLWVPVWLLSPCY